MSKSGKTNFGEDEKKGHRFISWGNGRFWWKRKKNLNFGEFGEKNWRVRVRTASSCVRDLGESDVSDRLRFFLSQLSTPPLTHVLLHTGKCTRSSTLSFASGKRWTGKMEDLGRGGVGTRGWDDRVPFLVVVFVNDLWIR